MVRELNISLITGDYCRKSPDMAMGYQNRMRDRNFYDRGNCMRNNPVAGG